MTIQDEHPLRILYEVAEGCIAGRRNAESLRSALYAKRQDFVSIFELPEKNATDREKLGKASSEIEAVAEMLRDVSTLSRDASIDITHAAMISLSDTANLLETSALKMVRNAILQHSRWGRDAMPDLGALALGVFHDERRFGYCVLRRLMQLRALVVEGAPEEAVAVATEFVDGLLEEREWAARLVKVAAKLYSPTAVDKAPPDNWLKEQGELVMDCVLYMAVREYYWARDTDTDDLFVAQSETIPVFGLEDSPAFSELIGLMRGLAEPSTGDTLYKFAVTCVFAVHYAASTHALRAKAPTKLIMQSGQKGAWRERSLEKLFMLIGCMALTGIEGTEDHCRELLKGAIVPDRDAFNRQTSDGALQYMRTRVLHSRECRSGEARELYLACLERPMSAVHELMRGAWASKGASVEESAAFKAFIELVAAVYKKWPQGTLKMLFDRNEMERVISVEFEAPRDAADFKQRYVAKANVYIALVHLLADLCNSPDAALKVYELLQYRHDELSCPHMLGILDHYTRLLSPDPLRRQDGEDGEAGREIQPSDVHAMQAMLRFIKRAVAASPDVRRSITESWAAVAQLFRLVSAAIPLSLKASVLKAVGAFVCDAPSAYQIWAQIDVSSMLQGLRQETAQIEVTDELYPGTLAFLELLNTLLKHSNQAKLYESLGLGLRVPGLQPYLDYVTEVLVTAEARGYRARYQKSKIMRLSLQFIETLLTQFVLEDADFADRLVDVGGNNMTADRVPALTIILALMAPSPAPMWLSMAHILHRGVPHLDELLDYGDRSRDAFKAHGHEEASALSVLRILEYILRTQASFLAMYNRMSPVSSLPAVMGAFEHALMTPVARGIPACVPRIVQYVRYDHNAELAFLAVSILHHLSESPAVRTSLVPVMRDTPREEIWGWFTRRMNEREPESDPSLRHSASLQDRNHYFRGAVLERLLQMLLTNVVNVPAPNFGHFLLGFSMENISETDLSAHYTVWHVVVEMVQAGITTSGEILWRTNPHLSELSYQLLYHLCKSPKTAAPALEYLRTIEDFFTAQVRRLRTTWPRGGVDAWAREYEQRGEYEGQCSLCSLPLLDGCTRHMPTDDYLCLECSRKTLEQACRLDEARVSFVSMQAWLLRTIAQEVLAQVQKPTQSRHAQRLLRLLLETEGEEADGTMGVEQGRRRLLELLDTMTSPVHEDDFEERVIKPMRASYRERFGIELYSSQFKMLTERGCTVFNIDELLAVVQSRQEGASAGALLLDMQRIMAWNLVLEFAHVRRFALDGWERLVEVAAPLFGKTARDVEQQSVAMLELMLELLPRLNDDACRQDFSRAVLLLARRLSQVQKEHGPLPLDQAPDVVHGAIKAATDSRSPQSMRANLYATLLNLMRASPHDVRTAVTGGKYSEALLETLGRDACDAGHSCKCVAFALLTEIMAPVAGANESRTDAHALRNYIPFIVAELARDDAALVATLQGSADSQRPVYLYEAKMAFLLAMAQTRDRSLLDAGAIQQLAGCRFLSEPPSGGEELTLRLLLSSLRFIASVLSSLQRKNTNAITQTLSFISNKVEIIAWVLKDLPSRPSPDATEAMELVTSIFFYLSSRPDMLDAALQEQAQRLHRLLLNLFFMFSIAHAEDPMEVTTADGARVGGAPKPTEAAAQAICTNILSYCAALMDPTPGETLPLFTPRLASSVLDALSVSEDGGSGVRPPSLSTLVHFLRRSLVQLRSATETPAGAWRGPAPKNLTLGAEASLYIVLLHLGYYLKDAPLAPEPGQLAPRFSVPMSPVEQDETSWFSISAGQRAQLLSNAASCLAQVLDDLDLVANKKGQRKDSAAGGIDLTYCRGMGARIRAVLALDRRSTITSQALLALA